MSIATSAAPAPRTSVIARQAMFDVRLWLRNGEQLLLTILIPVVLLVGLGRSTIVSVGDIDAPRIDVVVPGILALAVMSTAFTSLAISTGFDRRSGVLKILGATPLLRSGLVWSRVGAVLVLVAIQFAVLVPLAYAIGWDPHGSWLSASLVLILGVAAFGTLGVALAGVLRAEATLAAANSIYLLLLLGGGVVIPVDELPGPLAVVAQLLPSGALGEGLRAVFLDGTAIPWPQLAVLALWTLVGAVLATRTFRWE